MATPKKKSSEGKKPVASTEIAEDAPHATITVLGEVLLESLKETNSEELEIFEHYTHALKSKIHTRENDFSNRITKGYEVLLEALKK